MTRLPWCAGLVLFATLLLVPRLTAQEPPAVRVVQLCDPQLGMGGYAHDVMALERAVTRINALAPDLVVVCGDLVENPDDRSYRDVRRILSGLEAPVHWAPGNHDLGNRPTHNSLALYRQRMGPDRSVVEVGHCTFILANSSLWKVDLGEETRLHDRWIETTLARASARKGTILLVAHYPPFTVTPDEPEHYYNLPPGPRHKLLDLLERHRVAAYLAGHLHRVRLLEYRGLPIVCGETTSRMFDRAPLGFRLWRIEPDGRIGHRHIAIDTSGLPHSSPWPRWLGLLLLAVGWGVAAPLVAGLFLRFHRFPTGVPHRPNR